MKTITLFDLVMDSDWGCFGNFDKFNSLCRKRCALRLRCVVAREKIARMELLEELTSDELSPPIVQ